MADGSSNETEKSKMERESKGIWKPRICLWNNPVLYYG
ncbi:hypothetical protein I656_00429 [Geobacillus sp. WSUCF1]|nr:hypothetical protein I656_00429 [Geobacillus sp. WSUCF1]